LSFKKKKEMIYILINILLTTFIVFLFFGKRFVFNFKELTLSTEQIPNAFFLLQEQYKVRVKNMIDGTKRKCQEYKNTTDEEEKKKIVKKIIDFYLSPTSQDKIFGKDMVIYFGKGKPTIMLPDVYNSIRLQQTDILRDAGVLDIVKKFRIGSDESPWSKEHVDAAIVACKLN